MGAVAKKMLFQPPSIKYAPNMNFFDLLSREEGGKSHTIKAFFIRAASQDGFCILFSHGNAEDLSMIYPWFKDVAIKLGVNVCCYDYTGYGLSKDAHDGPSGPGEQHCFNDALPCTIIWSAKAYRRRRLSCMAGRWAVGPRATWPRC